MPSHLLIAALLGAIAVGALSVGLLAHYRASRAARDVASYILYKDPDQWHAFPAVVRRLFAGTALARIAKTDFAQDPEFAIRYAAVSAYGRRSRQFILIALSILIVAIAASRWPDIAGIFA